MIRNPVNTKDSDVLFKYFYLNEGGNKAYKLKMVTNPFTNAFQLGVWILITAITIYKRSATLFKTVRVAASSG
jgi:hypothetical protein